MKRLLIGLLLLITACSRDKDPEQQRMSNPDTSYLKEDIQGLMNSTLIQTDNGVIDLANRTKIEYNGEFRNTRPLDTKLTISHEFVDFGLVNGSQVVGYRLSVKNVGVDEALDLKISPDENFMVGSDRCTGLNLRTDEVCSFRILFTGKDKTAGEYKGKVSVFAEANTSVSSNLQAQVGESKNLQLESLQGLDVAFADRGTDEVVRNLRIVNRGPGVAERILVKTYSGEFKLLTNGCEGASLAKNQYCTLSISYDPKKNNTGRAIHSKLTVIPQDYSHNSLEINLRTTLSPILAVKEKIKEQDKSTKEVEEKREMPIAAPKLQAPNLAYNTKKLQKLNKQADQESKANQKQVQNAEKLLQSELLKEQEAEAKRLAELKAQELAAQIAAEKQKAAEEAARLKQERLEAERLAKEELAAKKQERLASERLAKEELARKQQEINEAQKQAEEQKAKQLAEQKAAKELEKQQKAELARQKQIAAQKEKELLAQQKQAELARQKAEAEAASLQAAQELAAKKQALQDKLAQEAKLKAEQLEQTKLQKEQSRLAKIKADEEQKAAQKQAELAKLALIQAEQAKQKAIEEEKAVQAQKLQAEQKAQAEAKILADKQAAEKIQAEKLAQAQAKALLEKQAAEKLQAEQIAKKEAELKAQAEAKIKAEQLLAEQHRQEDLARQKAEAEQLALTKKRQAEEQVRVEAERAYQAKVELERIAAEEKAAKEAEQYRLAQEEQERQEQIKLQELEAQKVAQEQAALAQKQADEQKAWVTYQQQRAYKETGSSVPVVNATSTSTGSYRPQITVVKNSPTVATTTVNSIPVESSSSTVQAAVSSDSGTGNTVLVPDANGTITGEGPLTKLEIQTSTPMEVSWFKGLTPYNLYQRIVPSNSQLMPIQVNPANLVEGRIINQRALVNLSAAQPLGNSDSTNLEREIKLEIKSTGKFESCSFTGVFSYLKCVAGTVTLMVKDLIHADKNLEVGSGSLVSNDVSISKYAISQVSQYLIPTSSTLPNQALYKGELYFQAKLLENQSKLFKISGLNIFQVSNLNPGKDDAPWKLVVHNSELYFAALDQNGFAKLFKTNGNQIVQLSNIFPQGNDYLTPAVVFNGDLYLEGMNSDGYLKLFKTDGKTITQISDTNPTGSDAPSDFMVYNSELYFRSQNMSGHTKLFKLNGEGIFQVSDINHNQHDAPEFLQSYKGYLYFSSFLENVGNKLFRTNGQVVEQVLSINSGNDEPSDLLVYNDELYFVAVNKEGYRKLYKTNGAEAMQVSNIKVGGSDFALDYRNKKSYLTTYNNELYFVAKNPANGFKIFKTNGQLISQVSNINEISPELNPTGSDFPFNLMVYSNELYFSAYGNTAGLKLFKLSSESTKGLR